MFHWIASTTASAGTRIRPARVIRSLRESGHAPVWADCEVETSELLEVVDVAGIVVDDESLLSIVVGSMTVTETGGAEATEIEVAGSPVPCGSSELSISNGPLQLTPSKSAFTAS